jgi:N-acetylglucosaminyl-diphospho-decaprenol L-rhamnosyltransferase
VSLARRTTAVVVDYLAGESLARSVDSIRESGVVDIVVVNNGPAGSSAASLENRDVAIVETGLNLGYGRGVNRGAAITPAREFLVVSNPDVVVHAGAIERLIGFLDTHPIVGIVGPTILTEAGETYPSVRVFPDPALAAMHALVSPFWPGNPWSARYRTPAPDGRVDWVSGAFFVIRRELFERLGGFDERYFMFAEEMDLCWRARELGVSVATCPDAVVTHVEGVSRRSQDPRAMTLAHHRGAMRFELRSARGWRRLLAPLAVAVLGLRLCLVLGIGRWAEVRRRHRLVG